MVGDAFYTTNLINFFLPNLWQCIIKHGLCQSLLRIHRHYGLWDYKTDDTALCTHTHRELTWTAQVILTAHAVNKSEWPLFLHLLQWNWNNLQNLLAARKSRSHYVPLFCLPNASKQLGRQITSPYCETSPRGKGWLKAVVTVTILFYSVSCLRFSLK